MWILKGKVVEVKPEEGVVSVPWASSPFAVVDKKTGQIVVTWERALKIIKGTVVAS